MQNPTTKGRVVRNPGYIWEAWNLGLLNRNAENTLLTHLGERWHLCYLSAFYWTEWWIQKSRDAASRMPNIFTTPKIAPFMRVLVTNAFYERLPEDFFEKWSSFSEVSEHPSMLDEVWPPYFAEFLGSLARLDIDPQKNLETHAETFFEVIKAAALEVVDMDRQFPCFCCPRLSFQLRDEPEFLNRLMRLFAHGGEAPEGGKN